MTYLLEVVDLTVAMTTVPPSRLVWPISIAASTLRLLVPFSAVAAAGQLSEAAIYHRGRRALAS